MRLPFRTTPKQYRQLIGVAGFAAGCLSTATAFFGYNYTKEKTPKRAPILALPQQQPKPGLTVPDGSPQSKLLPPSQIDRFSIDHMLPEPVTQVGLPEPELVKVSPGFLSLYDRRTKVPRWTLEHLTPEKLIDGPGKVPVDRLDC